MDAPKRIQPIVRWAGLWRSENRIDGKSEHLLCSGCLPILFSSRRQAREHIDALYGYIRKRPDLKAEPHGWKMPIPVRVKIEIEIGGAD